MYAHTHKNTSLKQDFISEKQYTKNKMFQPPKIYGSFSAEYKMITAIMD